MYDVNGNSKLRYCCVIYCYVISLGYSKLKPKQEQAITYFVCSNDVLVALTPVYGTVSLGIGLQAFLHHSKLLLYLLKPLHIAKMQTENVSSAQICFIKLHITRVLSHTHVARITEQRHDVLCALSV